MLAPHVSTESTATVNRRHFVGKNKEIAPAGAISCSGIQDLDLGCLSLLFRALSENSTTIHSIVDDLSNG